MEVRTWKTLTEEEKLNVEISENEVRKDFTKTERYEFYKRKLAIETAKAKERQATSSGGNNPQLSANLHEAEKGRAGEKAAESFGISYSQFRREGTIIDNKDLLDPSDFADWDEGKLSTNRNTPITTLAR